jgi:predicted TIM-barrel fold metal-dependent hydrolase
MDSGQAWMKLCSYRVSSAGAPFGDVAPNVQALAAAAPDRCVWGTDGPHSRMHPAPEAAALLDQLCEWVPDAATQQRIMVNNPARPYGF